MLPGANIWKNLTIAKDIPKGTIQTYESFPNFARHERKHDSEKNRNEQPQKKLR
jgi:hypothetical protein